MFCIQGSLGGDQSLESWAMVLSSWVCRLAYSASAVSSLENLSLSSLSREDEIVS
jgi:hypothetical protein